MEPTGVILYPKPTGVTSHDVVARVRRSLRDRLGERVKVGHAGTLDPFATGLLLVLVGRATRIQRYLLGLPKTYRVTARLGWRSDTGDRDGALTRTGRVPADPQIAEGPRLQRPPAYSAVKVGGERLYRRARRGDPIEGDPREIVVYRARTLGVEDERARFEIECSSGTYVRQLVADLDDAYCEQLERTAIGPFLLADADPEEVLPLERALGFLPERALSEDEARLVANGRPLAGARADGPTRLTREGRLVAIGEPTAAGVKPVVVFAG